MSEGTLQKAPAWITASSEKDATSVPPLPRAPPPKAPSCVVCRQRKVRCDRESPCSNCRRANIKCIFPSSERPPRWARRLERLTKNAPAPKADPGSDKVIERLRTLENLVKELSGQLEEARLAASPPGDGSSGFQSPRGSTQSHNEEAHSQSSPGTDTSSVNKQFGRLVLQDSSRSHYVSSGFWSRVNDEVSRTAMVTLIDVNGPFADCL